ncbi:MAG: PDDEXK nuclease domain-containing protein [Rickettsia endosymbiont of Oxypoda opaca]|nr:PDDEXK nuclease domain-containing protein [Rickettsia endosymbiont of Oxypoda opaca]
MNNKSIIIDNQYPINVLYQRISKHLQLAKRNILQNINTEMVKTYWLIGYEIVEEEQKGSNRAIYGEELIQKLSKKLRYEFGKGYSVSNLRNMRKFYLAYQNQIHQTVSGEFEPKLSWSQYCLLMQISNISARDFYEKEAIKNYWSVRELERQIGSLLYERLSRSKNKEDIIKLALKGQEIEKPQDAIKDPLILEFLNIPEAYQLNENKIEKALITNLQHFLLELGKGFAFVERQKRITLSGNNFYVDLVFYHAILKCYVLIELKTRKVTHADLGQIQFYVNYFDQEIVTEGDNPTIGLILCTDKNDAMVKYTLGEKNQQIFASKYQFHLPSEIELEQELKREIKEIEQRMCIKTIDKN